MIGSVSPATVRRRSLGGHTLCHGIGLGVPCHESRATASERTRRPLPRLEHAPVCDTCEVADRARVENVCPRRRVASGGAAPMASPPGNGAGRGAVPAARCRRAVPASAADVTLVRGEAVDLNHPLQVVRVRSAVVEVNEDELPLRQASGSELTPRCRGQSMPAVVGVHLPRLVRSVRFAADRALEPSGRVGLHHLHQIHLVLHAWPHCKLERPTVAARERALEFRAHCSLVRTPTVSILPRPRGHRGYGSRGQP